MEDRRFNEVDLKTMLAHARAYRQDLVEDRWVIVTCHQKHRWEIIVEPDVIAQRLVVVTAYPVWDKL